MRCFLWVVLLCSLMLSSISFGRAIPGINSPQDREMKIKGQFVVRFADDVNLSGVESGFGLFRVGVPSVESIFDSFKAEEVRPLFPRSLNKSDDLSRYYLVRVPDNQSDEAFLQSMSTNPKILSVEQDIACRVAVSPNDPSQSSQWWVYQSSGIDIDARLAWDIEQGSDTAIVAIIDTGVLYTHLDLKNNIWVNPGEDIDGDMVVFDSTDIDHVDSDGNGYQDDLVGYDFVSSTSNAWPGEDSGGKDNDPKDFNGHGTHCAGIAAAVTNNGYGGCGVSGGWGNSYTDRGTRIMCLRAGYSINDGGYEGGVLIMSAVAEAVNYAVNNGADVISYSAGSGYTSALYSAVTNAVNSGVVFCHAAGNDNANNPDYFSNFGGLISVAATNSSDRRWVWGAGSGSNYGDWIEVAAPGNNIYSTVSNHGSASFATYTGTSMACPMVAGLAALIKSHYPDYDKTIIDTLIINRADSINDTQFLLGQLGSGRINAYRCLEDAPTAFFGSDINAGQVPLTVNFTDASPSATTWSWDFGDGGYSSDANPVHEYTSPGYYNVSLQVDDPNGNYTRLKKSFVYVSADTIYADPIILQLGEPLGVELKVKNDVLVDEIILPIIFPATGYPRLVYDSVSVIGNRAEDFDEISKPGQSTNKVVLKFRPALSSSKNGLPPGDGVLATLWFTPTGSGNLIIDETTFGTSYELTFINKWTTFKPVFMPISVNITAYSRGDANGDGQANVGDAVHIVNYVFRGGMPPIDSPAIYAGDANSDFQINAGDAVYLISYVFRGGPPPGP
ncbi:MAG: S8 family serine peptidase [candidate division Zixibacteria bacterium]|nr:S8 family serine peptidase [candidate division Zixibacteria bacterium]